MIFLCGSHHFTQLLMHAYIAFTEKNFILKLMCTVQVYLRGIVVSISRNNVIHQLKKR